MQLKKSGKEYKGLCPFHSDKNPSLFVSPSKQIFKCFACGAGGDVFKFIQLEDRVEFPEAVRILAGRANIELPERSEDPDRPAGPGKVALAEANKWAARQFRSWLNEPVGEQARKYLEKRGFSDQTVRRFGLGFAPDAWDGLLSKARQGGIDQTLLAAAGLASESRRGPGQLYDTFRNRVMFPILDASDRVIGFGGRTLGKGDDVGPKYLNTAETALFNKRRELYGLRWGRKAVSDSGVACVVEGYTDVIMAHQGGHENVVAALGTALTEDHMRLLGRLAKRIVLVFDADAAGAKAADRALELFLASGVDLAVATMPAGLDPCDLIRDQGPDAWAKAIDAAVDALQFKWEQVAGQYASSTGTADRSSAVGAMLQTLAGMNGYEAIDPVRRGIMLDRLAGLLRTSADELNRMLGRLTHRRRPSGAAADASQVAEPAARPRKAADVAMAQLLGVLLSEPSYFDSIRQAVSPSDFADPNMRALAEPVWKLAEEGELTLTAVLRRMESPGLARLATDLSEEVARRGDLGRTLENAVGFLEHERQVAASRERADRVRSGEYTDQDLLELSKRPRDLRRGG
ncbi:MAG: DNA primase [Phycisphaerae bacterium]|nr:DNA primase [Phycisphaerae bacterium]